LLLINYKRSTEKRKQATLEIERLIRTVYENHPEMMKNVLIYIKVEVESPASRNKKAALLAFSSISLTIINKKPEDIHLILESCCKAINDEDSRIRFAACESIYNILNTCRCLLINEICFLWDNMVKVFFNILVLKKASD